MRKWKSILSALPGFLDRLTIWSGYCGSFLIFLGMFGINLDVFSRYFLHKPLGWAFDISRWTLLYATLLMGAWVLHHDGHVKIDIVLVRLKKNPKALVEFSTSILIVLSCLILFYQGMKSVAEDFASGMKTNDTTVISRFWLTLSIPAGSLLLIWQGLRRLRTHGRILAALLRRRKAETETGEIRTDFP
jgi:TRAP-type transport system small permease protein